MSMTRSQQDAALEEIYAQVPQIPDCDGRCALSCGPIEMFDRERARIVARGVRISDAETAIRVSDAADETFYCEALKDGRCTVYDIRPLICRIWGAVEDMRCPFGCVPERYLTAEEATSLLAQAHAIAGYRGTSLTARQVRETVERKAILKAAAQMARGAWESGRHGTELRVTDQIPEGLRKPAGLTAVQRNRVEQIRRDKLPGRRS